MQERRQDKQRGFNLVSLGDKERKIEENGHN